MAFEQLKNKFGTMLGYLQTDSQERLGVHNLLHVQEQSANATTGLGGLATGAWRTRGVGTVVTNNIAGASVSATSQITLPAGVYFAQGRAPQHGSTVNMLRIQEISPTANTLLYGGIQYDANMTSDANIFGVFTLSEQKIIELQHRVSVYNAAGYGGFGDIGQPYNIFAQLFIWKIS